MAVGAGDDGGIIGGFGAALDLQAVDPGVAELVQMVDHAHIAGIHDVRALFILEDGEIFAGALFLHQRVLVPAGLGTLAAVGVAAGHIVAEQAAARIGHAHGPVAERLKLQLRRDAFTDAEDLPQAQLPRKHNAAGAEIEPALRAGVVCDRLLRRHVALAVRGVFPGHHERTEIREDQRVDARRVQLLKISRERGGFVVARHDIDRAVHLHARVMRKLDRLRQLVRGKIGGKRAHTEAGSGQIDRIRTVGNGHAQLFHIPRWA